MGGAYVVVPSEFGMRVRLPVGAYVVESVEEHRPCIREGGHRE